jgi:ATPase subunit of ABC transporter with duplicated ATPase domains
MEPQKRVRDVLADGGDWIEVRGHKKHIKGYLKEFLFDPALVDAPIGSLSGGERSRLLLAREFARRGEPAGARRADQRPRPRDARPPAGGDRRL